MQNVPWEKDYVRCIQINHWIDVNSKNYTKKQIYELNNCVTRYFLSLSLPSANKEKIYRKFLQELKDKHLQEFTDIRHYEFTMLTWSAPTLFDVTVNKDNVIFDCGGIKEILPRDRYEILRAMSSDEDIVCMILRYATFSGSYGWQVPFKVYERLYDKYGLTLEGCASPVNSQMQKVSPFRGRYCSAFKEDHVFGSIGNIFGVDLEGEFALINPPFVEDFMLYLVNKVTRMFGTAKAPTTIIFVVPAWGDSEPHVQLCNSAYLKAKYDLIKEKHAYEDDMTNDVIKARFNSTVFVLSNKEIDISDAIELFKV
jgi:hypothetical protein